MTHTYTGKGRLLKWFLLAVLAVFLILLAVAGNYLVDFAIARKNGVAMNVAPDSIVTADSRSVIDENRGRLQGQTQEWLAHVQREDAQIVSEDGLALRGDVYRAETDSHRWVIAMHGYTGQRSDMQNIACFYGQNGCHVLTPDMRAHGESEGKYIGMGWLDRKDLLLWIDYVISMDPAAEILLHGVSMGAAAVMMTAGEQLPPQVKGAVEDCGYTSVWDIFSDELRYLFHLPAFPLLYVTSGIAKLRAGYTFGEASALKQVRKSTIPILFLHGSEDNFVHTEMVYELYDACSAPKDILVIEGAGHGESYCMDPDGYFGKIIEFLRQECGWENI